MLINKSSIVYNQRRPAPSFVILLLVFIYALFTSGCAGVNPLSEYNFTDATLVVEAPVAPRPSIVTNSEYDILDVFEGSAESIFRATTAVVKETQAHKARKRIKEAAEDVDVSMLVAEGIAERAERYLGFAPANKGAYPDLVLRLRIAKHGLYSGPAFDGRTEFFLDAYVELIDDYTGESLWNKDVSIVEPVSDHFLFSNILTSKELSDMSEAEMQDALYRISDYTADYVVRVLRREIHRAQR